MSGPAKAMSATRRAASKFGRLAAVLATSVLALAACSGSESGSQSAAPAESTLARAQKEGVIRVGYANEAPYAYVDSASDRLTGESPEIARIVLGKLGIDKVEGVLTEFGSLIPGLQAKRFDIIAAGMYILPERCEQITFSNPTYAIGEAFLVRNGNPKDLHGYADVAADSDAKVGVVTGAVELSYARKLGVPEDRIVLFPTAPEAVAGVETGRVDAYAATALTARDLLERSGSDKLELAQPFVDSVIDGNKVVGYGAFGFRKDDTALIEAFNRELAGVIGSSEHLELVKPFGFSGAEVPGDVTAAQLCTG